MSATEKRADLWLEQKDVQYRIKDAAHWEGEWIPVYVCRNSYIEHFYGLLLPVSFQRAPKTMKDLLWAQDFDYSRAQIAKVRLKHTHYLGLRFRRLLALRFGTSGYFAHDKGISKQITQRVVKEGDTGKSDTILVRRDAVLDFIQRTEQVLLWCVRSVRYSERRLEDFGMEVKPDRILSEGRYCYDFEQRNLYPVQKNERPRMETMSQVFGKRIVRLTNEA